MRIKNGLFFILTAGICLLGATYRWGDSAHSIGMISSFGGKVRHPSLFQGGEDHYILLSTATVIPPYRGDAKIILEGAPGLDYDLYLSAPVLDLRFHHRPLLEGDTLYGLNPGIRISVWVRMRPKPGKAKEMVAGKWTLAFYDTKTNRSVMRIPLVFTTHKNPEHGHGTD